MEKWLKGAVNVLGQVVCELDPALTQICMFIRVCPQMIAGECECVCVGMLTQLGSLCSQIHLAERAEPIR